MAAGVSAGNVITDYVAMTSGVRGRAAASVSVSCRNPGTDHEVNVMLADICNAGKPVSLNVMETYTGITARTKVGLGIPQIALRLVDNGWAGHFRCQLSMEVDNPSNLPLEVSVWQLVATDSRYESVNRETVCRSRWSTTNTDRGYGHTVRNTATFSVIPKTRRISRGSGTSSGTSGTSDCRTRTRWM